MHDDAFRGASASPFRDDFLRGQVAVVTGGGTGIGRAVALALARHGADVCVASRKIEHVGPAAKEIEALGRRSLAHTLDIRRLEEVEALAAAVERSLGPASIVVNNASGLFLSRAEDLSANGFDAVVRIILHGSFHMAKAFAPQLFARRGTLINMLTTSAWTGWPGAVHNSAGKGGLLALTRSLALEWGPRGVRVNGVAPGPVDTEATRPILWPTAEVKAEVGRQVPLGRIGEEEDVAGAVLFLASSASSWVNGEARFNVPIGRRPAPLRPGHVA